jgi:tRNA(Ile)-lysidine synthase
MWIEDPANTNPAFERVRVRMRLAELASQGFDPMRLCALAAGLRPAADTLNNAAAGLIAQAVRFKADRIVIEASCWRGDAQVRQRVLAVLLAAAAGVERAPPPMAVARLEARLLETTFFGATLAGAALTRKRDVIAIGRDLGAVQGRAGGPTPLPRLSLEPGAEAVWDGRLALTAPEPGWSVEAGANGAPVLAKGDQIQPVEAAPVRWRWLLEDHMRHLVEAG